MVAQDQIRAGIHCRSTYLALSGRRRRLTFDSRMDRDDKHVHLFPGVGYVPPNLMRVSHCHARLVRDDR